MTVIKNLGRHIVVLEVVVHVDKDVVVQESEQARTGTLPKNLIARLSRAGSLGGQGSEASAHASNVRAKLALGMAESSNTEGEERGLLSRSTWVWECVCQRMESSYIGAEERRREWTWTLLTTIIPIKRQSRSQLASGAARRASARACGTPFSFYQLHKWSTVGPPFKLVKILIDFQCGLESLAFILWTF
jgi:hypothetical protein